MTWFNEDNLAVMSKCEELHLKDYGCNENNYDEDCDECPYNPYGKEYKMNIKPSDVEKAWHYFDCMWKKEESEGEDADIYYPASTRDFSYELATMVHDNTDSFYMIEDLIKNLQWIGKTYGKIMMYRVIINIRDGHHDT